MREILFRGKRVDNGEWVEGYCAAESYTKNTYNHGYILENEKDLFAKKAWLVDSRTVGQSTGMTDKNGKKIFEGDIVKLFDVAVGEIVQECGAFGIGCRQLIDFDYLASEIAPVTGHNNTPLFCYNDNFVSLWELYWNYNEKNDEISVIEVIGNIHDNPELLEVVEE